MSEATKPEAPASSSNGPAPDALAAMAAEVDAGLGPAPGEGAAPAQSAAVDEVRELAGALELVAVMVRQLKPALADVWTPQAMEGIARAAVPVVHKYGWTVGGLFAQWGAEIGLIAAAAPVAIGTAKVLGEERARAGRGELPAPDERRAGPPAPVPAAEPAGVMPRGGVPVMGIPPSE